MSVGEIADYLGVDSLAYLDLDRLVAATGAAPDSFCVACFTGHYPVAVPEEDTKHLLEDGQLHIVGSLADPSSAPDVDAEDPLTYTDAGVDIAAGEKAVELIKAHVQSTFRKEVIGDVGGFGGLFAVDWKQFKEPLLVSSTDGVGTKSLIARMANHRETIGIDCVAMSVDDIAAEGAEPLFFLDYISIGRLVPEEIEALVAGVARAVAGGLGAARGRDVGASRNHGAREFDLVGFAVGIVERSRVLPRGVRGGDRVIGLASPGLRCNGYSLARAALFERGGRDLNGPAYVGAHHSLAEELLHPSVIYAPRC